MGIRKTILGAVALALLSAASSVRAGTVTFATYADSGSNQWHYDNASGLLSADNAVGTFSSLPVQILNYNGAVSASVYAQATDSASGSSSYSQPLNGELIFTSGTTTVLDIIFVGALLTGSPDSSTSSLGADGMVVGQAVSMSADPSVMAGQMFSPFSFTFNLNMSRNLAISGGNYASFDATATGAFSANVPDTATANILAAPLPAAVWGGLGLMGLLGGAGAMRKRLRR